MIAWACRPQPAPTSHDVYVWQRTWTPQVITAVREAEAVFEVLHVQAMVAEPPDWTLRRLPVDVPSLAKRGGVPVVRIEVGAPEVVWAQLGQQLGAIATAWQAAGVRVEGVEIDHDCPTRQLPVYTARLKAIQAALPEGVALWNTALPTWSDDPDAVATLREVTAGSVLQVHAVDAPASFADDVALFAADRARAQVAQYAGISERRFRIALPAYGVRLDAAGRLEAEADLPTVGASGRELWVEPAEVSRLLADVQRDRPRGWVGTVWFRLPTAADRRAWPLETIARVVRGEAPVAAIELRSDKSGELYDLSVVNRGGAPGALPETVTIVGSCTVADGVGGYSARRVEGGWWLQGPQARMIRPGARVAVGWVRCATPPTLDVP